jgi:hypothetical protein
VGTETEIKMLLHLGAMPYTSSDCFASVIQSFPCS